MLDGEVYLAEPQELGVAPSESTPLPRLAASGGVATVRAQVGRLNWRCVSIRGAPVLRSTDKAGSFRSLAGHELLEAVRSCFVCSLTFELSGRRRQDARPALQKMYTVPAARAWWPAVGAPLERGVRPHWRLH